MKIFLIILICSIITGLIIDIRHLIIEYKKDKKFDFKIYDLIVIIFGLPIFILVLFYIFITFIIEHINITKIKIFIYQQKLKSKKKKINKQFNTECLNRDNNKCKICGSTSNLKVYHIIDKNLLNNIHIKENGITLCHECKLKAEKYYQTNNNNYDINYHPDNLYKLINSSRQFAILIANQLI